MKHRREPRRWLVSVPLMLMAITAISIGTAVAARAEPASEASDPNRATVVDGHVNSCVTHPSDHDLGFPPVLNGRPVLQASGGSSGSNGDVTTTILPNDGMQPNNPVARPGEGQMANITVASGVTVLAISIEGGDGYNLYKPPHVPPTEPAPTRYIPPFVGTTGGNQNLPGINHWFVCYQVGPPPPPPPGDGQISVSKVVLLPDGTPVTPPPSGYTASVTCSKPAGGGVLAENVTFSGVGGNGSPNPALTGLPPGTICRVSETTPLPPGATVSYDPATANTTGVEIAADTTSEVTITNDFSNVPVEMASLHVNKVVTNPGGAATPANWTAQVTCDSAAGDTSTIVTMPGAGGPGEPVIHPVIPAVCQVQETNVPAGWSVAYSVNGGAATSTPPSVNLESTTAITLTVTNLGPECKPPSPSPTASPSPGAKPSPSPTAAPCVPKPGLPVTGAPPAPGGLPPLAFVIGGLVAIVTAGAGVAMRARR